MAGSEKTYCSVCAWRKTCQKRFTMKNRICPDYTRDLSLPLPEDDQKKELKRNERTDTQIH